VSQFLKSTDHFLPGPAHSSLRGENAGIAFADRGSSPTIREGVVANGHSKLNGHHDRGRWLERLSSRYFQHLKTRESENADAKPGRGRTQYRTVGGSQWMLALN
jgi:hypothetical protein